MDQVSRSRREARRNTLEVSPRVIIRTEVAERVDRAVGAVTQLADNDSSNYSVFDSGEAPLDITPQAGLSEQKPDIDQSTLSIGVSNAILPDTPEF